MNRLLAWLGLSKEKYFPVWTENHYGEIRKSVMIRTGNTFIVRNICKWVHANEDGTLHPKSYVKKWWLR